MIKQDKAIKALKTELHDLIFFDPANLFTDDGTIRSLRDIPEKERKVIKSLKVRQTKDGGYIYDVQLHDKISAIINLAKHLGFYEEDNTQQAGINNFSVLFAEVEDIKSGKVKELATNITVDEVEDDFLS